MKSVLVCEPTCGFSDPAMLAMHSTCVPCVATDGVQLPMLYVIPLTPMLVVVTLKPLYGKYIVTPRLFVNSNLKLRGLTVL